MSTLMMKLLFAFLWINFLTACATSPTGRTQLVFMPDTEVNSMGLQAFDTLKREKQISHDAVSNRFVSCVASAITREVGGEWEVVVFEDQSLNAFALPGGKIGVHTGLLNLVDNQDQLAVIIGHEVGHVMARHSNERLSQQVGTNLGISLVQAVAAPQSTLGQTAIGLLGIGAQYGIIMPYSRLQESEADMIGLDLMAKAGFNPSESIKLWQKMEQASQGAPVEFLSTHPSHASRIQNLQAYLPKAQQLQKQANIAGKNPHCTK
ncbi:Peptidase family M48 [Nitrosomonas eutropha]|uniref:M48 family metallopeptidase n=1 Tax=Nitrosomonas TaxID=914 RepID=UPI00088EC192|nr:MULTISPECIES: M48 family metallopeptidase [Nitrosomonas]MXS80787.1 M48 family peptidase [Nitrosomonas sp. GH22]SCX07806.1 Peptidase family M48 [Nitrosomonas eutropha]SDW40653.1 Peptidase family M48 [Nitrosomonas eutropha]